MIKLIRRELDAAVEAAGREKGSVKLISNAWFYQLENRETWRMRITMVSDWTDPPASPTPGR